MGQGRRVALAVLAGLATLFAGAPAASAEEYRLRVVSIHEQGFYAYLKPGELTDGVAGPGLDRLQASLDRGDFPIGAVVGGRQPTPAGEARARAWGGVPVRVEPPAEAAHRWTELRWQGKPGEQSVFVIAKTAGRPQEVVRVALRGVGPMRQYQVYVPPPGAEPALAALRIDLGFLWSAEERGDVWTKYVAPVLDLGQGIGVVVGANAGALLADHVYLIVKHAEGPTTYEAVLAWRQSSDDRQGPADHSIRLF